MRGLEGEGQLTSITESQVSWFSSVTEHGWDIHSGEMIQFGTVAGQVRLGAREDGKLSLA